MHCAVWRSIVLIFQRFLRSSMEILSGCFFTTLLSIFTKTQFILLMEICFPLFHLLKSINFKPPLKSYELFQRTCKKKLTNVLWNALTIYVSLNVSVKLRKILRKTYQMLVKRCPGQYLIRSKSLWAQYCSFWLSTSIQLD